MSIVVGFADIRPDQITRKRQPGGQIITTSTFLRTTKDVPIAPTAYIARFEPGCAATPHYHLSDEFQIIFDGKGKFGRHDVSPYCVHFARAYTSYGPLLADKETGWAFITLRTRYDPGSQRQFDEMRRIPDRRPWQITKKITFPSHVKDVSQQDDPDIRDEQGLLVRAISMAPNTKISTPDPSSGDGQFVVVFKGSLLHESKEHKALAVVSIQPGESPFQVHAGEQGLDGLILSLPQVKLRPETRSLPATAGFKKWQCTRCAFAYDEAVGMPDEGIAVGTRWEDVPETWSCPDCSAHKSDFEMIEV